MACQFELPPQAKEQKASWTRTGIAIDTAQADHDKGTRNKQKAPLIQRPAGLIL